MRKIIITGVLGLGLLLSVLLEGGLNSKNYFTLSFSLVLSLYWCFEFVLNYVDFRLTYDDGYKIFKAELVNRLNLKIDEIDDKIYYKKFKRTMLNKSVFELFKPLVLLGLSVAIIFAIIY